MHCSTYNTAKQVFLTARHIVKVLHGCVDYIIHVELYDRTLITIAPCMSFSKTEIKLAYTS